MSLICNVYNYIKENNLSIEISSLKYIVEKDGNKTYYTSYAKPVNLNHKQKGFLYMLAKMRANGEELNKEPRIKLSTIHSVKGGEEDNVIILPDLTMNTQKSYERNRDDENRLFYVGATRAKEHLHVVRPKDENKAFPMGDV